MILAGLALFLQVQAATPPRSATPAATPAAAAAPVSVRTAARTTSVPVTSYAGFAMVAGDRLAAALGGTFRMTSPTHYTLTVGESRISFTDGVPFAGDDSTIVPLAAAPRVVGQTVYLPYMVVSELVPRFISGFNYDADAREIRAFNTAARRVTPDSPTVGRSARDVGEERAIARVAAEPPVHPKRAGKRLVVIDAGHGGVDPGMKGPLGGGGPPVVEKYITLAVAKLVAQALRESGTDVLMTRTTDTLIGLYDRGPIANRNRGDVFVSIHVNATGQRGAAGVRDRGYETYFLAEAKTEDAKRVERMENEAVKFETGASASKGDPLSFIINDMAQNEHLRESADLAQAIQDGMKTFHPGPNRGVQQANFAVLRGAFMPAVLVEIGFGTNPQEAAFISDPDNQRTIARSIAKSVLAYLDRYEARVGGGAGR
jgi:N-acetylmuramoyl-L-alanine amidase